VAFLNCAYTLLPKVSIPDDFKGAMEAARARYVEAGILLSSPLAYASLGQVSELALAKRLPLISLFDAFPKNGGLLSYGPNLGEIFKRSASYLTKTFQGKKPSELPIQRPEKFDLVINLKTATALGVNCQPCCSLQPTRSSNETGRCRLLARSVISRQRNRSVAFGAKRT